MCCVFGCDTVDIKYALKVIVMYFRVLLRGEPRNVFFGVRNEFGASGAELMQYITDAVSVADLEYGYDIRRKLQMESELKQAENEQDLGIDSNPNNNNTNINNMSNNNNNIVNCSDEVDENQIYTEIARDVLDIIVNNCDLDESDENVLNDLTPHEMGCICNTCIEFAFSEPSRKRQRLMRSSEIEEKNSDIDIIANEKHSINIEINSNANNSNTSRVAV